MCLLVGFVFCVLIVLSALNIASPTSVLVVLGLAVAASLGTRRSDYEHAVGVFIGLGFLCLPVYGLYAITYNYRRNGLASQGEAAMFRSLLAPGTRVRFWGDGSMLDISYDATTGKKGLYTPPKGSILSVLSTPNDGLAHAGGWASWDLMIGSHGLLPVQYSDHVYGLVMVGAELPDLYSVNLVRPNMPEAVWVHCRRVEDNFCYKNGVKYNLVEASSVNGQAFYGTLLWVDPAKQLAEVQFTPSDRRVASFNVIRGRSPYPKYTHNAIDDAAAGGFALLVTVACAGGPILLLFFASRSVPAPTPAGQTPSASSPVSDATRADILGMQQDQVEKELAAKQRDPLDWPHGGEQ
jgi:hypothetical protein